MKQLTQALLNAAADVLTRWPRILHAVETRAPWPAKPGRRRTPRLILHVGGAKCGSSSLQSALSHATSLAHEDGTPAIYAAITRRGRLLYGRPLRAAASRAPVDYVSSGGMGDLETVGPARRATLKAELGKLLRSHGTVILSAESWLESYASVDRAGLFQGLDSRVEAVCFVRPQVPVLNSSWWQWGAWQERDFDEWMQQRLGAALWARLLRDWRASPWVSATLVLPLDGDIVAQFCEALGLRPLPRVWANESLPADVLRLYQRHGELRAGPHASGIDFALRRHLTTGAQGRRPWVMHPALIESTLARARPDVEELLTYLDDRGVARVAGDPRWSSASAYRDKVAVSPWAIPPDPAAADRLCAEMAEVIHRLDREVRQLRQDMRDAPLAELVRRGRMRRPGAPAT